MESYLKESHPNPTLLNQGVDNTESVENFQKFIYDLFDKNGILNDLRAYLRGHIVDVLKSAQTGDPPPCQKHFTQRLDSPFQALNMLVAEYLLCSEFNYTLSVFVSEIPLANMVFGLAKSLMGLGADGEATGLRFGDNDVWAILNYLGVKCDSEHANAIIDMYKAKEKSPLLLCILKCAQLFEMEQNDAVSQEDSISTNSKNSLEKRSVSSQCKHDVFCKACRGRYKRLKEKYRKKKAHYVKKAQANAKTLNVENLMKNIGELERNLVDEMFEQLKTVFETELDMFKAEHEDKIKNSLASHAQHFQQMQNELEETYKVREEALKTDIEHKKRFLWGLAKALREQHSQMNKAMQSIKKQTAELTEQEKDFKLQRTEAEESLKKHAEEMRRQIADELMMLEQHLDTVRAERENIEKEKYCENQVISDVKKYLQNHYHLWRDELNVLKMCIQNTPFQSKGVVERSMVRDDFQGLNNEIERDRGTVREGRPNQVVNDLKKQNNVNFSQGKSEADQAKSQESRSSSDSEVDQHCERQPIHITPDSPQHPPVINHSLLENGCGWRKGAGEERSLLPTTQILVPGDTLPFVGVVGRRNDSRKHLLNRWRAIRRRISPLHVGVAMANPVPSDIPAEKVSDRVHSPPSDLIQTKDEVQPEISHTRDIQSKVDMTTDSPVTRKRSSRSVLLKEAKEKLKTVPKPSASREKSPSAVLREAKRRLRKLEIEAEAVERSYMDFRRRDRRPECLDLPSCIPNTTGKLSTPAKEEVSVHSNTKLHTTDSVHLDLEKYLKKYQINLNMGQYHFKNKDTAAALKNPVPEAYSEMNRKLEPIPKQDYLEKPILEFRKLYYTNPERAYRSQIYLDNYEPTPLCKNDVNVKPSIVTDEKDNKRKELENLKPNISKKNDLQDATTKQTLEMSKEQTGDHFLLVEVENMSEVKNFNNDQSNMVIVIKSSIDTVKEVVSENVNSAEQLSTKTTIVSPKMPSKDVNIERIGTPIELVKTPPVQENISRSIEFFEASGEHTSDNIIRIESVESRKEPYSELQITEHNAVFSITKEFFEAIGEQTSLNNNMQRESRNEPDSELKITEHNAVFDTVDNSPVQENFSRTKEFFEASSEQTSLNNNALRKSGNEPDYELQITEHNAVFETVDNLPVQENFSRTKEFFEASGEQTSLNNNALRKSGNEPDYELQITEHNAVFETVDNLPVQENFSRTKEFFEASGEQPSLNNITLRKSGKEPDSELKITEHNADFESVITLDDYLDDFSDDVDNYKSDVHSPISLPKSYEDENFWD